MTDTVEYTYGNAYWSDRLTAINVNGTSKNISYATYLNPSSWYNGTQFTNLTWTQGRRLSSITKGSQTYSYEYDMSGIRSAKVADGLRHEYVTQSGKVVREIVTNASTGAFQYALDFTYDEAGHPLTMRKYNNADMQTNYITMQYVCNAQGDVVKLINNGTVYAEYTYDAWGNVLTATENGSYNYAALNPLRYRGYYYDSETGFYYLQSRYYDPALGRFLNADSYASTGQGFLGYNMFAYCGNNPGKYADCYGHYAILAILPELEQTSEQFISWWESGGRETTIEAVAAIGTVLVWLLVSEGTNDAARIIGEKYYSPKTSPHSKSTSSASVKSIAGSTPATPPDPNGNKGKKNQNSDIQTPDVKYPGNDPTQSPGDNYKWRGPDPQGGKRGGYVNVDGSDSWHPDLDHPDGVGPHWDYNDPFGHKWRVYPDWIEFVH